MNEGASGGRSGSKLGYLVAGIAIIPSIENAAYMSKLHNPRGDYDANQEKQIGEIMADQKA